MRALLLVAVLTLPATSHALFSKKKTSFETYNEGVRLLRERKFVDAQAKFEEVLKRRKMAEAHNNLAYCLRKQGAKHFDEALVHYNRAVQLRPELPEPYMYRGVLYVQLGRLEDARSDLAKLEALSAQLAVELQWVIENGREKEPERFFGVSGPLSVPKGTKPAGMLGE